MARQIPIALAVLLVGGLTWAVAQPPVQKVIELQPNAKPIVLLNPNAVRQLEENVELLEAQLDIKRAYLKAAEVTFEGNNKKLDVVQAAVAAGRASAPDFINAKLDRDVAAAQVEIRKAEAAEVAVKLKHAKLRLNDAKGKAAPGQKPKPVVGAKEVEDAVALAKVKLLVATAKVEQAKAGVERAVVELKRLRELATKGIVAPADLKKAAIAVEEAQAALKVAEAEVQVREVELNAAMKRLEEAKRK